MSEWLEQLWSRTRFAMGTAIKIGVTVQDEDSAYSCAGTIRYPLGQVLHLLTNESISWLESLPILPGGSDSDELIVGMGRNAPVVVDIDRPMSARAVAAAINMMGAAKGVKVPVQPWTANERDKSMTYGGMGPLDYDRIIGYYDRESRLGVVVQVLTGQTPPSMGEVVFASGVDMENYEKGFAEAFEQIKKFSNHHLRWACTEECRRAGPGSTEHAGPNEQADASTDAPEDPEESDAPDVGVKVYKVGRFRYITRDGKPVRGDELFLANLDVFYDMVKRSKRG